MVCYDLNFNRSKSWLNHFFLLFDQKRPGINENMKNHDVIMAFIVDNATHFLLKHQNLQKTLVSKNFSLEKIIFSFLKTKNNFKRKLQRLMHKIYTVLKLTCNSTSAKKLYFLKKTKNGLRFSFVIRAYRELIKINIFLRLLDTVERYLVGWGEIYGSS